MKKILRITKYLENQGISLSSFERDAGLGYSYLGKIRDRGGDITQKMLDRIQEKMPEHYYKIFPEEANSLQEEQAIYSIKQAPIEKDYNHLIEKFADIIADQQNLLKQQHSTIHEMVTNWPGGGNKSKVASR